MALLGCIADDFTGGTDLALNLTKAGFRTVQTVGVPSADAAPADADAIVVALKTRTCPPAEAVRASLEALAWLRGLGCRQFYFKYCSTFDSTAQGNIGPVTDALLDALGEKFTIACPAFPDNGRTVYHGHLFVNGTPLGESSMKDHPLTPMRDSNLVRVLSAQTRSKVGLVNLDTIAEGPGRVAERFLELAADGVRIAITDTVRNADLRALAVASLPRKLLTGGSALGCALGVNFDLNPAAPERLDWPMSPGRRAIVTGSCSRMTLRQLEHARRCYPSRRVNPIELARDFEGTITRTLRWVEDTLTRLDTPVVYCSGTPAEITESQQLLGVQHAGELCERALARIAVAMVDYGVTQLIVAGGETSGAVVSALGVGQLQIGPEIDPGVPWTFTRALGHPVALAMKSGNFGSEHFLTTAWGKLNPDRPLSLS